MAKRSWHVIISPMHIIQLSADTMEQVGDTLIFKNIVAGKDSPTTVTIGQFNAYMGWLELVEQPKEPGTVTPLSLVPRGDPPPPSGDAA